MISGINIADWVIQQVQSNKKHCNQGRLTGVHDREAGVVNILQALPDGIAANGCLKKVGSWGTDIKLMPAFPRPDEVFLHVIPDAPEIKLYRVLSQDRELIKNPVIIRSKSDLFQRVQGLLDTDRLSGKSVVIVGVGSVGSIIVLELAKAGVGQFFIYDPDTFLINNVCRHIGDITDVGRYKVQVVKENIQRRNPHSQVQIFKEDVLKINIDRLREEWKEVDLIIAATDSQAASLFLNEIALDFKIPLLQVGLYERASWGHIIYIIPDKTPCLACVLPDLAKIGEEIPRKARIIDYSSVEDVTQIKAEPGLGADIGFVSMAVAKVALALLLGDDPSSMFCNILPPDKTLLVVANSPGSIFPSTKAFQTHWVNTQVREDCEWCQKESLYLKKYGKETEDLKDEVERLISGIPDFYIEQGGNLPEVGK